MVRDLSCYFEELRRGYFDVNVPVERLGAEASGAAVPPETDGRRPFLVCVMGPGVGDEALFAAEHEDELDVEAVLGFKPRQAVVVAAGCNKRIDHMATALLTTLVVDVVGGVVNAEVPEGQEELIAGLPGVLGMPDGDAPVVVGTAEFLRAWVLRPGFRLVK